MNYGEIKQNIISLGFAEESDYEEYEDLGYTYDAINQAIKQINTAFPYVATYDFEITDEDTGTLLLDFTDLYYPYEPGETPEKVTGFLSFGETPMYSLDGSFPKRFSAYEMERDCAILIDADKYKGNFRIFFNKECTKISSSTLDNHVPELPLKVHHLIPLLASYYLWLDDDERKATQYYNQYETAFAVVKQEQGKPKMRVVGGWGDDLC